jgi:outer membrane protein TolC
MMFEQGTASRFDVLQSKVQVALLIPQLVNADNALDLIMAEFKKLLSLDMKDEIGIRGELKHKEIAIREDEFLNESYSGNPQMILKLLGIDINKWGIEFAKAGWLPDISASANYNYRSNDVADMLNERHGNWSVGVKASIAIFDGFATKAKVDEAKAMYRQSIIQKADFTEQLAVDVKNACLNMKEAKAVIDAQKDSIIEAKEALRLSEVRFTNGVGINLDVLDAQVSLAQVEQYLAQGIYDYIMAKAALDQTMGREFFKEASYYED